MARPKVKVCGISRRERIAAMGTSKDKKDDRALPWLVGDPDPTAEVIEEIVNRFHVYAMLGQRKLHSGNEEEKRIARTFLKCCEWGGIVRVYFKDKARQIDTKEARDIAQKARNVVDEFYDWFQPRGPFTEEDWKPYMKLLRRWERVVQRFNMCMNSGNPDERPAERKQNRKRTIASIIISLFIIFIFVLSLRFIPFTPFTWLKNHPNSYGLQGSIIFLIPCLIVGLFKPQSRKWCWGVGAIAFIVLLLSLMGGPADSNVN